MRATRRPVTFMGRHMQKRHEERHQHRGTSQQGAEPPVSEQDQARHEALDTLTVLFCLLKQQDWECTHLRDFRSVYPVDPILVSLVPRSAIYWIAANNWRCRTAFVLIQGNAAAERAVYVGRVNNLRVTTDYVFTRTRTSHCRLSSAEPFTSKWASPIDYTPPCESHSSRFLLSLFRCIQRCCCHGVCRRRF